MLCDLRPVQQMAIVPLLALLENSVLETSLCHNLLTLVHQVSSTLGLHYGFNVQVHIFMKILSDL